MCWLTNAWPSTTRVTVFFRSAPSARMDAASAARDGGGRVAARAPQNGRTEDSQRARRNRPPAARWAARPSEMHRRCQRGVQGVVVFDRRWVRSSDWRWSSPASPERRRRTAGDAAACTAASRRVRGCRAHVPGSSTSCAGASTMGRAGDAKQASASAAESSTIASRRRRDPSPSPRTAFPCDISARAVRATAAALRASQARW